MAENSENLASIADSLLDKLAKLFDRYEKPNWRSIISALPKNMYSPQKVEGFGMTVLKARGSPTKALLKDLGRLGKTVSDLIGFLKALSEQGLNVSDALSLLQGSHSLSTSNELSSRIIRIIQHPAPHIGIVGQEVELSCQVSGEGPLSFQWFHNKSPTNVSTPILRIVSLDKGSVGYYICRISNRHSCVFTNWARVDSIPDPSAMSDCAPLITVHPRSVSCRHGEGFRLFCDAFGSPAPVFQWYLNDQEIPKATGKYYIIETAEPLSFGKYTCVASNNFGTAMSLAAFVNPVDDKKHQPTLDFYNVRGGRPSVASLQYHNIHGDFPVSKVALLVGNQNYVHEKDLGKIVHPLNDTRDIAGALSSIGFTVVSLADLNLSEFKNAVSFFCQLLSENVYALFYFAGHGFEVHGESFLMPVDATAAFSTSENISASEILTSMVRHKSKLNMLMLDCCRTSANSYLENPLPKMCQGLEIIQGNVVLCFGCCSNSRVLESPMMSNGFFAKSFCAQVHKNLLIDVLLYEVSNSIHKQRIVDPATGRLQVVYRHSTLVEPISLCDPVSPIASLELDVERRLKLWRILHETPPSPVTVFRNDVAKLDFIFAAEFSNVLLIQSRIYSNTDCSIRFLLPSSIGGAKVDIMQGGNGEKGSGPRGENSPEPRSEVVRISNLELLEGDLTVHIEVTCVENNQKVKHMAFYTLDEKPLYAKIKDFF